MSRFARRLGSPALSLVCVLALGWPHAVRTTLYRSLYPLVALDHASLAASPAELVPLGYLVDDAAELAHFRAVAEPVTAGIDDESVRLRKLTDFIYSYHPGRANRPIIEGGRERGARAIFADIQTGKFALCGQKTLVLAAMWRSLGGDVRQIRFSRGDDIAWFAAHYGIEVYSARWRKWFYFDATLNGFATSDTGEPLSLVEINDHVASGEPVTMVASDTHFDWTAAQFIEALRANQLQVYSLDNRFRGQDPDRRFGRLNFGYAWLSALPRPFDKLMDAVTGDAATRFVAAANTEPPASAFALNLTANRIEPEPSPSDPPRAARAGRGRHRPSF